MLVLSIKNANNPIRKRKLTSFLIVSRLSGQRSSTLSVMLVLQIPTTTANEWFRNKSLELQYTGREESREKRGAWLRGAEHNTLQRRLTRWVWENKRDKQGQIDKDLCWGHVLFARSCFSCPLPVWPVIRVWLSLSADYRWPCVDPCNLQSNHVRPVFSPELDTLIFLFYKHRRTLWNPLKAAEVKSKQRPPSRRYLRS